MASKSCTISVVVMTSSSKSWGHCYDVSTGEVASNSTWDTRRPYWLPLSIITFLLLFTRVVSHGHRMINHSLADTCKAHARCIGSIPALVAAVPSIHVSPIASFAYLVTDSSAHPDYAVLFPPTQYTEVVKISVRDPEVGFCSTKNLTVTRTEVHCIPYPQAISIGGIAGIVARGRN
ncbi:hypothetical protein F5141DRAFT_1205363 [Pisolithus sp. B1]|nr:hypothetical protein F5141DRAFT_1205363 [Pisolithus sp. B1]